MIAFTSPFQKWMNENLQGIAFSSDIHELIAMAFAGGLEEAAKECDDYAAKCVEAENWEAEDVSLINAAAIRRLK